MCGFGIIVMLTLILGLTALTRMHTLADLTVKMHDHPLAVSNAVRDIRANIFAMHRTMKDMASAKDDEQINVAKSLSKILRLITEADKPLPVAVGHVAFQIEFKQDLRHHVGQFVKALLGSRQG